MKRILSILGALLILSNVFTYGADAATIKNGTKCQKLDQIARVGDSRYTCQKLGNSLKWVLTVGWSYYPNNTPTTVYSVTSAYGVDVTFTYPQTFDFSKITLVSKSIAVPFKLHANMDLQVARITLFKSPISANDIAPSTVFGTVDTFNCEGCMPGSTIKAGTDTTLYLQVFAYWLLKEIQNGYKGGFNIEFYLLPLNARDNRIWEDRVLVPIDIKFPTKIR